MQLIKVNFHSAVDVITNSSTTIFTYSEGCGVVAKSLIDEFLKVLGSDKKADDIFWMGVFADDFDEGLERLGEDFDPDDDPDMYDAELKKVLEMEYKKSREYIESMIKKVLSGEMDEPKWLKSMSAYENYSGFNPSTSLYIFPKDEKYKDLGEKIIKFLYSTESDGGYDG